MFSYLTSRFYLVHSSRIQVRLRDLQNVPSFWLQYRWPSLKFLEAWSIPEGKSFELDKVLLIYPWKHYMKPLLPWIYVFAIFCQTAFGFWLLNAVWSFQQFGNFYLLFVQDFWAVGPLLTTDRPGSTLEWKLVHHQLLEPTNSLNEGKNSTTI